MCWTIYAGRTNDNVMLDKLHLQARLYYIDSERSFVFLSKQTAYSSAQKEPQLQ